MQQIFLLKYNWFLNLTDNIAITYLKLKNIDKYWKHATQIAN